MIISHTATTLVAPITPPIMRTLCLLALSLPTLAVAQAPTNPIKGTGTVVLKAARVIDGTGAAPIQNGVVVVTDIAVSS